MGIWSDSIFDLAAGLSRLEWGRSSMMRQRSCDWRRGFGSGILYGLVRAWDGIFLSVSMR